MRTGSLVCTLVCAWSVGVGAQERLPPVPAEQWTVEQRRAMEAFTTARGLAAPAGGPFPVLLRSPEVMERTRAMGDYLRYKSALPPRLSEFVILLTAREWSQEYEWNVHHDVALKAGVPQSTIAALAAGRRPDAMSAEEAALYDFCSELLRDRRVTDAAYGRVLQLFGERGVVDTTSLVGYYSSLAMMLNVARTAPGASAATPLRVGR